MAKPKMVSIKPVKTTTQADVLTEETKDDQEIKDLKIKLDTHINDKNVHITTDEKDAITYLRKDLDSHAGNDDIHVTKEEKTSWNSKETPSGAQAKANKVMNSLTLHKEDYNIHITRQEKDLLMDKYTKAETRNLLKHGLTGLVFLKDVNTRSELKIKYPNPEFNSCVFVKSEKNTLIFNGTEWVIANVLLTPESTSELNGLMSSEDKAKLDTIEANANYYTHPDDVDTRHVADSQINYWNNKAENKLATILANGLMSSEDKSKLDTIETGANNYTHPEKHEAAIIIEDETHRFVTDEEKSTWNTKATTEYVKTSDDKVLSASKAFTNTKIATLLNSTDEQLQVLRSLAFELKKDDIVKQFFDLFNECTKNEEFQNHSLNSKIHMSQQDRTLLNDVKEALTSGLNPDWNETDQSSLKYIENKPKALPADGGNADTLSGYTAEDLLSNRSFYDYTIGSEDYTIDEVSVLAKEDTVVNKIDEVIDNINKGKGYNVLFKPGQYTVDKELVIRASNTTISGIGEISTLLGASITIIGNNNTIKNINLTNLNSISNNTALYVEGNNNIIINNNITNFNNGIIVEGSNNIITNNNIANIRNCAIKLTAEINANYGNSVKQNTIKASDIGIVLISSKNSITKSHVLENKVFNCSNGILLSNTINDKSKTTLNIINENIVMRGKGTSIEYLPNHKTIASEFSSKNIISSNITSGKEIVAPNDILNNNIF